MKTLAFLAAFLLSFSALAQGYPCGVRAKVLATLEAKYAETPTSIGLASNGAVIEVLVSDTGSWTILTTLPNGLSCLVAAGENWENMPALQGGTGL